jgi:protein-S-isoprenylcysteine O-methyltransferase Ste14
VGKTLVPRILFHLFVTIVALLVAGLMAVRSFTFGLLVVIVVSNVVASALWSGERELREKFGEKNADADECDVGS